MRRLPFLAFCYLAAFTYHAAWKWFIPVTLPALLAGVLGFFLVSDLPQAEGVPAALVLVSMVAIAWWNWWNAEALRDRVNKLEDEVDELYVYETPDGEPI
jgi:uncharacterized membrane protein YfcA